MTDRRHTGGSVQSVRFATVQWITGEGHAAKTAVLKNVNTFCDRIDVLISSVTANPTVAVTFADENSVAVIDGTNFATLADGTNHILLATKATPDFPAASINNDLTISVDPSADAGGAAQILTVTVIMYGT